MKERPVCKKHPTPYPMIELREELDNCLVGWWCVFCHNFIPNTKMPNLPLLQTLVRNMMAND